jgi:hypothetical protein
MSELVGLQGQPIDVMAKLSQLLQVRSQQQALEGQAAQVQQEQQTARQRAGIAKYDWNKHIGADGTIDVESVASDPELAGIAGDSYIDLLSHVAQAKQGQLTQKSTLLDLRTEQRKAFAEMMNGLRSDKDVAQDNEVGRRKVNDEIIKYGQMYGADTLPVIEAYAPGLQKVPQGRMGDALRAMGLQALSAEQQASALSPQYANRGDSLVNVNPNADPNSAPDIKLQMGPGADILTDANGRQFRYNTQNNTVTPVGAPTGGGKPRASAPSPSAAPDAPTFVQPVPGQKDLETHVSDVRKADSDYGLNRHVNDEILRLSADTATGPGTKAWHNAIGKVAGLAGGDSVSDFQKIGAYLDRQSALAAQQMGLPDTNAGLATAANLTGTTEYAPGALQTKVKLTDALVEGAHQYRKGLDKVIGTGPNQDLSKLQAYRSQWADNFDPNVFRVENALRRGDKKELSQIKDEVGTNGMADLKLKSENLERLERGELLK